MPKGSAFERKVARILSEWITNNKDVVIWRSHGSGSLLGLSKNLSGDMMAIDTRASNFFDNISVECKHVKDFDFWDIITGRRNGINSYWKQCVRDAKKVKKIPVLIPRKNYKPILFITDHKTSEKIVSSFKISPKLISSKFQVFLLDEILLIPFDEFYDMIVRK